MNTRISKGEFYVVGAMSGTSLDGLDLVLSSFSEKAGKWSFIIHKARTIAYNDQWKKILANAHKLSANDLIELHNHYGIFIGRQITEFLGEDHEFVSLIASHGHTVFHQPEKKLTFQLGSGATIAANTKVTTVSDFRTLDVALGGQGAPLVPVGDELLFGDYTYCLNMGGFANISHNQNGLRIACDICPANIVSNHIAKRNGCDYDKGGEMGKSGRFIPEVVESLNNLPYYRKSPPKSLGREWVEKYFMPVLSEARLEDHDVLFNFYEHVAYQISRYINDRTDGTVLVTGGGAYNDFLMSLISQKCRGKLCIPHKDIIEYKEALIFAFLGLLRYLFRINCLASVTGASSDSSSGIIHFI